MGNLSCTECKSCLPNNNQEIKTIKQHSEVIAHKSNKRTSTQVPNQIDYQEESRKKTYHSTQKTEVELKCSLIQSEHQPDQVLEFGKSKKIQGLTLEIKNKIKRKSKFILEYKLSDKIENTVNTYYAQEQQNGFHLICKMIDFEWIRFYKLNKAKISKLLLLQLQVPSLCRIIKFIADEENYNKVLIFTQYVSNGSLLDFIKQYQRMDVNQVRQFCRQYFLTLSIIHQENLYHGNLKPSNILLQNNIRKCKLTDFYLFQKIIPGFYNTEFQAPETLLNDQVTWMSDMWVSGYIILYLLLGKSPWSVQFGENLDMLKVKLLLKQRKMFNLPSNLNNDLADMLNLILCLNPCERITAKQCLFCKFLQPQSKDDQLFMNHELYSADCYSSFFCNSMASVLSQFMASSLCSPSGEKSSSQKQQPQYQQKQQQQQQRASFSYNVQDIETILSSYKNQQSLKELLQKHEIAQELFRTSLEQNELIQQDKEKLKGYKYQEELSYKSEKCSLTAQSIEQAFNQCQKGSSNEHQCSQFKEKNSSNSNQASGKSSSNGQDQSNISQQIRNLEERLWQELGLSDTLQTIEDNNFQ